MKLPSKREMIVWSASFQLITVLVVWLVYCEMVNHHEKHGHWYWPLQGIIVAIGFAGIAIIIPIVWLLQRRENAK